MTIEKAERNFAGLYFNRPSSIIPVTAVVSACGTATTLLAFVPMLLMQSNTGSFMRSMPVTVVLVLTASFFIAVTLALFPQVGVSLFPTAEKPQLLLNIELPESSSFYATQELTTRIEEQVRSYSQVKAALLNVSLSSIDDIIRTSLMGSSVGSYRDQNGDDYEIVIRLDTASTPDINNINNLLVMADNGALVPRWAW